MSEPNTEFLHIGYWLWLLQWLCLNTAAIISSSEAIISKGAAASILAVTAVTAAFATAAVDPLLGKWECLYCDSSWDILRNID